jgi:hypothetical protein
MYGWLTRELSAEVTSHNGKTILLFLSVFIGNVLVTYVTFLYFALILYLGYLAAELHAI